MGLGNWLLMYAFSTAFYQTSLTGSQSSGDAAAATVHCLCVLDTMSGRLQWLPHAILWEAAADSPVTQENQGPEVGHTLLDQDNTPGSATVSPPLERLWRLPQTD